MIPFQSPPFINQFGERMHEKKANSRKQMNDWFHIARAPNFPGMWSHCGLAPFACFWREKMWSKRIASLGIHSRAPGYMMDSYLQTQHAIYLSGRMCSVWRAESIREYSSRWASIPELSWFGSSLLDGIEIADDACDVAHITLKLSEQIALHSVLSMISSYFLEYIKFTFEYSHLKINASLVDGHWRR